MKEIALTQGKFAIVDDEDFEALSKFKWCFLSGHAVRHSNKTEGKKRLIFMHRQVIGAPDRKKVFQINKNRLDCRRENIRFAEVVVKVKKEDAPEVKE